MHKLLTVGFVSMMCVSVMADILALREALSNVVASVDRDDLFTFNIGEIGGQSAIIAITNTHTAIIGLIAMVAYAMNRIPPITQDLAHCDSSTAGGGMTIGGMSICRTKCIIIRILIPPAGQQRFHNDGAGMEP